MLGVVLFSSPSFLTNTAVENEDMLALDGRLTAAGGSGAGSPDSQLL